MSILEDKLIIAFNYKKLRGFECVLRFCLLEFKEEGVFLADFSDMQLKAIRRNRPGKWKFLISELESQGPLLFDGNWIDRIVGEWIDKIDPQHRPLEFDYGFVRSLIRFVRNRWCPDKFRVLFLWYRDDFCSGMRA